MPTVLPGGTLRKGSSKLRTGPPLELTKLQVFYYISLNLLICFTAQLRTDHAIVLKVILQRNLAISFSQPMVDLHNNPSL